MNALQIAALLLIDFPLSLVAEEHSLRLLNNTEVPATFKIEGISGVDEVQVDANASLTFCYMGNGTRIKLVTDRGQGGATSGSNPVIVITVNQNQNQNPYYGMMSNVRLSASEAKLTRIKVSSPIATTGIRVMPK